MCPVCFFVENASTSKLCEICTAPNPGETYELPGVRKNDPSLHTILFRNTVMAVQSLARRERPEHATKVSMGQLLNVEIKQQAFVVRKKSRIGTFHIALAFLEPGQKDSQVLQQCNNCTFANHENAVECAMCGEPLPYGRARRKQSVRIPFPAVQYDLDYAHTASIYLSCAL